MSTFNYTRAAMVLAYGKLFGKNAACKHHEIASGTYDGWKNRLNSDSELESQFKNCVVKLTDRWEGNAVRTLNKGLQACYTAFEIAPFENRPRNPREIHAYAQALDSLAKAIKSIGELTIVAETLKSEEDE